MDILDWFIGAVMLLLMTLALFQFIEAVETRELRLEVERTNAILERIVP